MPLSLTLSDGFRDSGPGLVGSASGEDLVNTPSLPSPDSRAGSLPGGEEV